MSRSQIRKTFSDSDTNYLFIKDDQDEEHMFIMNNEELRELGMTIKSILRDSE